MVALVMKPHTFQPTRAGFFFREADGSMRVAASYRELVFRPEGLELTTEEALDSPVSTTSAPAPAAPITPVAPAPMVAAPAPAPAVAETVEAEPPAAVDPAETEMPRLSVIEMPSGSAAAGPSDSTELEMPRFLSVVEPPTVPHDSAGDTGTGTMD